MVQHFAKECLVPSNSSLPLLPWLTHEEHLHPKLGLYLALLGGKVSPQARKPAAVGWP